MILEEMLTSSNSSIENEIIRNLLLKYKNVVLRHFVWKLKLKSFPKQ
jgi:hypothetical protein